MDETAQKPGARPSRIGKIRGRGVLDYDGATDGAARRGAIRVSKGRDALLLNDREREGVVVPETDSDGAVALRTPGPSRPAGSSRRLHELIEGPGWVSVQLLTDLLAAVTAVVLASLTLPAQDSLGTRPWLLAFPLTVAAALHLRGLYRHKVRAGVLDQLAPMVGAVSAAAMVILAGAILLAGDDAAGTFVGRVWAMAVALLVIGRAGQSIVQRRLRVRRIVGRPTLIIGAGIIGAQVARRLEENPEYGLRPIGFLDADPVVPADPFEQHQTPILGTPDDVIEIAAMTGAQHIIFAFTRAPDRGLTQLARRCEEAGLEVSLVPRFFESINDRVQLERIGSLPLFSLSAVDPKGWQFGVKYALDRVVALVLLVLAAPVLAVLAIAVKLSSPGPVLFRQRRVGRDGQVFDLYKFRSMRPARSTDPFELKEGTAPGGVEGIDRRTGVGRFLRRSGLDELPQLVNVLRGEMSLVGPRPERPEFVDRFGRDVARYTDRHRVKSGITGWAQVSDLRGQTSLQDRIEWDNDYIENWSLWLDVKVVLLTLGAILRTGDDA